MKRSFAIGALALLPQFASAENIELSRPIEAGLIHEGGIDMVVYFVEREDRYETVITYATQNAPHAPRRLRMGLTEGDKTTFALPDTSGLMFTFARQNNRVQIATQPGITRAAWLDSTQRSH